MRRALTDPANTHLSRRHGVAIRLGSGFRHCHLLSRRTIVLGEVLCVRSHHRLSYVIRPPAASAVYLTWLLQRRSEGCICRLRIDEADTSDFAELEDVWLPIMAGLQRSVAALSDEGRSSDRPQAVV